MSKFYVGQKIMSIKRGEWRGDVSGMSYGMFPAHGDVVTVTGHPVPGYVSILEHPLMNVHTNAYNENKFVPVQESLSAELAAKAKESWVEERPDKVPEPQHA